MLVAAVLPTRAGRTPSGACEEPCGGGGLTAPGLAQGCSGVSGSMSLDIERTFVTLSTGDNGCIAVHSKG